MLLFCFFAFSALTGQSNAITGKSLVELRRKVVLTAPGQVSFPAGVRSGLFVFNMKKGITAASSSFLHRPAGRIPNLYAYDDLALFCKLEVQLERTFRLPVKIRLGDVQYVDWLEGKRDNPGN